MLSFSVFQDGRPAERLNLAGAYLVGSDDVPLRAEIEFAGGVISCKKRAAGPAGLVLPWQVPGSGTVLLDTVRVPERERPYVLQVELARARLVRINQKLEDWSFLDLSTLGDAERLLHDAREALIRALQAETDAESGAIAEEALALAIRASELLTAQHAKAHLERRMQGGGFTRRVLGCAVTTEKPAANIWKQLAAVSDFVTLPLVWRDIEPTEQAFQWKPLDAWVELLTKHNVAMRGSPLLSFSERHVPDWLYIWEHDFDTIRDLAFEHVRRVINRYGQYVPTWHVISGIHADNCFTFNFEQLMELTRMTTALTKQLNPRSTAVIELVSPWGEYYARNQRTVPPLLYADMIVQSGVSFDAFGLRLQFGPRVDGMFVRDMFQISSLLDGFGRLGRPVHVTAVQVPSKPMTDSEDGGSAGDARMIGGGVWREPWSEQIQADWLEQFLTIALSKPFVESICWQGLMDQTGGPIPSGGLLRSDLSRKPAFERMAALRNELRRKVKPA